MEKLIQIPESAKELIVSVFLSYRREEAMNGHIEKNIQSVERWLSLNCKVCNSEIN